MFGDLNRPPNRPAHFPTSFFISSHTSSTPFMTTLLPFPTDQSWEQNRAASKQASFHDTQHWMGKLKPVFHYANLFVRRQAKTEIWHHDWSAKKAVAKSIFARQSRCRICNSCEQIRLVENGLKKEGKQIHIANNSLMHRCPRLSAILIAKVYMALTRCIVVPVNWSMILASPIPTNLADQ